MKKCEQTKLLSLLLVQLSLAISAQGPYTIKEALKTSTLKINSTDVKAHESVSFDYTGFQTDDIDFEGNLVLLKATKSSNANSKSCPEYTFGSGRRARDKIVMIDDTLLAGYTSDCPMPKLANNLAAQGAKLLIITEPVCTAEYETSGKSPYTDYCDKLKATEKEVFGSHKFSGVRAVMRSTLSQMEADGEKYKIPVVTITRWESYSIRTNRKSDQADIPVRFSLYGETDRLKEHRLFVFEGKDSVSEKSSKSLVASKLETLSSYLNFKLYKCPAESRDDKTCLFYDNCHHNYGACLMNVLLARYKDASEDVWILNGKIIHVGTLEEHNGLIPPTKYLCAGLKQNLEHLEDVAEKYYEICPEEKSSRWIGVPLLMVVFTIAFFTGHFITTGMKSKVIGDPLPEVSKEREQPSKEIEYREQPAEEYQVVQT